MKTSPEIGELVKARIAAAAEIRNAGKNAKNPHLGNKYADLESVLEAISGIHKHGLALFHAVEGDTDNVIVTALLAHDSGQFLECSLAITPEPNKAGKRTAQQVGSAITYGRRYTAAALLGITQADDDGNEASGVGSRAAPDRPSDAGKTATDERVDALVAELNAVQTNESLKALMPRLSKAATVRDKIPRYKEITDAFHAAQARIEGEGA